MKKNMRILTEEEIKSIPGLLEGKTIKQVAEHFGTHERTINSWVRRLREAGYVIHTRVGRRPINLKRDDTNTQDQPREEGEKRV